jgi:hypothetical protein
MATTLKTLASVGVQKEAGGKLCSRHSSSDEVKESQRKEITRNSHVNKRASFIIQLYWILSQAFSCPGNYFHITAISSNKPSTFRSPFGSLFYLICLSMERLAL